MIFPLSGSGQATSWLHKQVARASFNPRQNSDVRDTSRKEELDGGREKREEEKKRVNKSSRENGETSACNLRSEDSNPW